jgi:hypothetical protein
MYLELEETLLKARIQRRSNGAVALIDASFQIRTADNLFLDRSGWLKTSLTTSSSNWQFLELAVQNQNDLDWVSFLQFDPHTLRQQWVVDVWKKGSAPQLLMRHEMPWMPRGAHRPTGHDEGPGHYHPSPQRLPNGKG